MRASQVENFGFGTNADSYFLDKFRKSIFKTVVGLRRIKIKPSIHKLTYGHSGCILVPAKEPNSGVPSWLFASWFHFWNSEFQLAHKVSKDAFL